MKKQSRVIVMTAVLLIAIAVWLPGLRSPRVAAQSPTLTGSYGFTLTPVWSGADTPAALMGVVTFDGAGNATTNCTIVQVNPDANASSVQVGSCAGPPGTYTVNADGTGTLTFPGNGGASTFAFVITDGGSGLMVLPTGGFGNHLFTGTARKQ